MALLTLIVFHAPLPGRGDSWSRNRWLRSLRELADRLPSSVPPARRMTAGSRRIHMAFHDLKMRGLICNGLRVSEIMVRAQGQNGTTTLIRLEFSCFRGFLKRQGRLDKPPRRGDAGKEKVPEFARLVCGILVQVRGLIHLDFTGSGFCRFV
ncbi:MAG TPA: hypothetical protein VHH73_10485 [Verrucomicrobiae bacterium]|nr:hypothetical protein [Verrucomicrobiae bacterium]